MIDVSCIIITCENEETIESCIQSIVKDISGFTAEIVCVDNASSDSTVSVIRNTKSNNLPVAIIENRHNLGFARGVNQGIAASSGNYLLILNPDTEVRAGFFEQAISFLKRHPEIGIVAPQHVTPEGRIIPSCREFPRHLSILSFMVGLAFVFPKSRRFNGWKMGYFDHKTSCEVPQPMGACLLVRREDVDEIGYMDERFRMFFNDVDWCHRFHNAGKKAYFLSHTSIVHHAGHSINKKKIRMILSSHRAFAVYFSKYFRGFKWVIPNVILYEMLVISGIIRILFRTLKIKKQ